MRETLDTLNRLIGDLSHLMQTAGMETSMELNEILIQFELLTIRMYRLVEETEK